MNNNQNLLQLATKFMCGLLVLTVVFSCTKRTEKKLGETNWRSVERTLVYDTETIVEDSSQFAHYLSFNSDGSFYRTYEKGTWEVDGETLFVTSFEADCESTYKIVKCTNNELVLESKKLPGVGFVACSNGESEDPKITAVYERAE
jgi:hypothetical protein